MTDTAPAATDVRYEQVDLRIGGVGLTVAAAGRDGDLAPVVFLHGFGSTKEDYLDIACQRAFTGRPFLAYDAPGCGETRCEDLPGISIPFLVKTAQAVLDHAGIRRFHLVGHSMGGLTALMLAHQEPDRVLSFTDIEGNLAPEDCFLSRQILTRPATTTMASSTTWPNGPAVRAPPPAPCSRRACATRSVPARCAGSSSRWSICPTAVT